jgi:hypothetical protein
MTSGGRKRESTHDLGGGGGRQFQAGFAAIWLLLGACTGGGEELGIPSESEWVEYGVVLEAGPAGSWDERLAGASTPSTLVRKNGTFFLYYGGADGSRSVDGGPRHRAIGVASSADGIRFTKHAGNPVMTHLPRGGEEEGANSAAVVVEPDGRFVMLYGAATEIDRENINADGRIAFSGDGLRFVDSGLALDHSDPTVYGYGDEIFPLAAYLHLDRHYVFYVTGGGKAPRDLAVAWGSDWSRLAETELVLDGDPKNPARMGANVNRLADGRLVLFIQRGWHPHVRAEVRTAHPERPYRLSPPIESYDGPLWSEGTKFFTVYLDVARKTWFLYRLNWNREFVLHLAPYLERDRTPPTAPTGVRVTLENDGVRICWDPAEDPDTGVVTYRLYRDSVRIGATFENCLTDAGRAVVADGYRVAAVNLHGVEGTTATALGAPGPGS